MIKDKIGFIGAGNMGEALVKGVLKAELLSTQDVYVSDIREVRLQKLQKDCGITTFKDNKELASKARIIVLAVKPQNMEEVLKEIASVVSKKHLIISIAAGITTSYIAKHFKSGVPIIRVMPNTPALIQEGASALARGKDATDKDLEKAQRLFDSVGKTVIVDESLMDAVTSTVTTSRVIIFETSTWSPPSDVLFQASVTHAGRFCSFPVRGHLKPRARESRYGWGSFLDGLQLVMWIRGAERNREAGWQNRRAVLHPACRVDYLLDCQRPRISACPAQRLLPCRACGQIFLSEGP